MKISKKKKKKKPKRTSKKQYLQFSPDKRINRSKMSLCSSHSSAFILCMKYVGYVTSPPSVLKKKSTQFALQEV